MKYQRLSFEEREEISRCLAQNIGIRAISKRLNRSPSTISREIQKTRKWLGHYRCVLANSYAKKQRHTAKKIRKLEENARLRIYVVKKLEKYWSPQQIAKTLKKQYAQDMDMQISHESIYSYLYVKPRGSLKEMLIRCLRQNRQRRKHKFKRRITNIVDKMLIDERPPEVEDRVIPGHWEGDLIIGTPQGAALGTLVERTTRMTFMVKVKGKDASTVRKRFADVFKSMPRELKKTLTYDQGREMSQHKLFTKSTKIQVFFAHPRSPWERGTNENTNGLIRQFFPKGTDFDLVSDQEIKKAQRLLNGRPRQILDWEAPEDVFSKLVALAT